MVRGKPEPVKAGKGNPRRDERYLDDLNRQVEENTRILERERVRVLAMQMGAAKAPNTHINVDVNPNVGYHLVDPSSIPGLDSAYESEPAPAPNRSPARKVALPAKSKVDTNYKPVPKAVKKKEVVEQQQRPPPITVPQQDAYPIVQQPQLQQYWGNPYMNVNNNVVDPYYNPMPPPVQMPQPGFQAYQPSGNLSFQPFSHQVQTPPAGYYIAPAEGGGSPVARRLPVDQNYPPYRAQPQFQPQPQYEPMNNDNYAFSHNQYIAPPKQQYSQPEPVVERQPGYRPRDPALHGGLNEAEARARDERKNAFARELDAQIQAKKEAKAKEKRERMAQEAKAEAEAAEYNPWGRGGGGAPLRDADGNVVTNLRGATVIPSPTKPTYPSLNQLNSNNQYEPYQQQPQQNQMDSYQEQQQNGEEYSVVRSSIQHLLPQRQLKFNADPLTPRGQLDQPQALSPNGAGGFMHKVSRDLTGGPSDAQLIMKEKYRQQLVKDLEEQVNAKKKQKEEEKRKRIAEELKEAQDFNEAIEKQRRALELEQLQKQQKEAAASSVPKSPPIPALKHRHRHPDPESPPPIPIPNPPRRRDDPPTSRSPPLYNSDNMVSSHAMPKDSGRHSAEIPNGKESILNLIRGSADVSKPSDDVVGMLRDLRLEQTRMREHIEKNAREAEEHARRAQQSVHTDSLDSFLILRESTRLLPVGANFIPSTSEDEEMLVRMCERDLNESRPEVYARRDEEKAQQIVARPGRRAATGYVPSSKDQQKRSNAVSSKGPPARPFGRVKESNVWRGA